MTQKVPLALLSSVVLICFMSLRSDAVDIVRRQNTKTSIELSNIFPGTRPGDKPITLSEKLLGILFPGLKNPRRMSIDDLIDIDQKEDFYEEGYTFVLRGDFNRDGIADIAFVGKYDGNNKNADAFMSILSIKGKRVIVEHWRKLPYHRAAILVDPNYKKNIDGINIMYTFGSEECETLYWDGKQWKYDSCLMTVQ